IPLSILLGFLSYQFIEKINFPRYSSWKEIYKVKPFYIFLVILACGYTVKETDGIDTQKYGRLSQVSEKTAFLHHYEKKHQNLYETYWLKCNTYSSLTDKNSYNIDPSCIQKKGENGVFLWGDSHAEALSYGLRNTLQVKNIPFYQVTSAGCTPSLGISTHNDELLRKTCNHSNNLALDSIKTLKPKIVIIAQRYEHDLTNWNQITKHLKKLGVTNILLIGPVPQWQPSLPETIVKAIHWKSHAKYISDSNLDLDIIALDKKTKKITLINGTTYISLIDKLCVLNSDNRYSCRVKVDKSDDLIQVDYGHLSEEGSVYVVNKIRNELLSLYQTN
ncbi:SGNH hydrolase domain-containing protein, partial [Acinetobacter faecalis]